MADWLDSWLAQRGVRPSPRRQTTVRDVIGDETLTPTPRDVIGALDRTEGALQEAEAERAESGQERAVSALENMLFWSPLTKSARAASDWMDTWGPKERATYAAVRQGLSGIVPLPESPQTLGAYGEAVAEQINPLNLGLTIASPITRVGKAIQGAAAGAQIGMGASETAAGLKEGDLAKTGMGAVQTAFGALGAVPALRPGPSGAPGYTSQFHGPRRGQLDPAFTQFWELQEPETALSTRVRRPPEGDIIDAEVIRPELPPAAEPDRLTAAPPPPPAGYDRRSGRYRGRGVDEEPSGAPIVLPGEGLGPNQEPFIGTQYPPVAPGGRPTATPPVRPPAPAVAAVEQPTTPAPTEPPVQPAASVPPRPAGPRPIPESGVITLPKPGLYGGRHVTEVRFINGEPHLWGPMFDKPGLQTPGARVPWELLPEFLPPDQIPARPPQPIRPPPVRPVAPPPPVAAPTPETPVAAPPPVAPPEVAAPPPETPPSPIQAVPEPAVPPAPLPTGPRAGIVPPETPVRPLGEALEPWTPEPELPVAPRPPQSTSEEIAVRAAQGEPIESMLPPTPGEGPGPRNIVEFTPEQIAQGQVGLAPKTFQFKGDVDERGVTGALAGVEEWGLRVPMPDGGTVVVQPPPIRLFQDADGKLWVADGHQRFNLYLDLMRKGRALPNLRAEIFRASDGWTVPKMIRMASMLNIQEGSAKPLDIARLIWNQEPGTGGAISDLELMHVPKGHLTGERLRRGVNLGKITDPAAQSAVINREVDEVYASFVGELIPNPKLHLDVLRKLAAANLPNQEQARTFVALAADAPYIQGDFNDILGGGTTTTSTFVQMAKLADAARKALGQMKSAFNTQIKRRAMLEKAGNRLAHEANIAQLTDAKKLAAYYNSMVEQKGTATNEALHAVILPYLDGSLSQDDAINAILAGTERDIASGRFGGAGSGRPAGGPSDGGLPGGSAPDRQPSVASAPESAQASDVGFALSDEAAPPQTLEDLVEAGPTRAELEAAGQGSMFGEEPGPPPVASIDELEALVSPRPVEPDLAPTPLDDLEAVVAPAVEDVPSPRVFLDAGLTRLFGKRYGADLLDAVTERTWKQAQTARRAARREGIQDFDTGAAQREFMREWLKWADSDAHAQTGQPLVGGWDEWSPTRVDEMSYSPKPAGAAPAPVSVEAPPARAVEPETLAQVEAPPVNPDEGLEYPRLATGQLNPQEQLKTPQIITYPPTDTYPSYQAVGWPKEWYTPIKDWLKPELEKLGFGYRWKYGRWHRDVKKGGNPAEIEAKVNALIERGNQWHQEHPAAKTALDDLEQVIAPKAEAPPTGQRTPDELAERYGKPLTPEQIAAQNAIIDAEPPTEMPPGWKIEGRVTKTRPTAPETIPPVKAAAPEPPAPPAAPERPPLTLEDMLTGYARTAIPEKLGQAQRRRGAMLKTRVAPERVGEVAPATAPAGLRPKPEIPEPVEAGVRQDARTNYERARAMQSLMDNPTPENLDTYMALTLSQVSRENRKQLVGGTGKEVKGATQWGSDLSHLKFDEGTGEYLGSGFGALQAFRRMRPEARWQLVSNMAGMFAGAAAADYFGEDDWAVWALMGLGGGMLAGNRANWMRLRNLLKQVAPGEMSQLREMARQAWQGTGRGVPKIRRGWAPGDLNFARKYLRNLHAVDPKLFDEVFPAYQEFAQAEARQPSTTQAMYDYMRNLHLSDAQAAVKLAAREARTAGHVHHAAYLDEFYRMLKGAPIGMEKLIHELSMKNVSHKQARRLLGAAADITYLKLIGWAVSTGLLNKTQVALAFPYIGFKEYLNHFGKLVKGKVLRDPQALARLAQEQIDTDFLDWSRAGMFEGTEQSLIQNKATRKVLNSAFQFIAWSDNTNRRAVYIMARDRALKRGLSRAEAEKWALDVTMQTQGIPGDLGSNPYHRQLGPGRALAKYPVLWSELASDVLTHPDPAVKARGLALILGAVGVGTVAGLQALQFIVPRLSYIGPTFWGGVDLFKHGAEFVSTVTGGSYRTDHRLTDEIFPSTTDMGRESILVPRYPSMVANVVRDRLPQSVGGKGVGLGQRPIVNRLGETIDNQSLLEDLLQLGGTSSTRAYESREQRSEQYAYEARERGQRVREMRRLKAKLREAIDTGDRQTVKEIERQMTRQQRREFYRNQRRTPKERIERRLPKASRPAFKSRFGDTP